MDKDEILLRSKNENRHGDEREMQNREKAESFGNWIVMVILFILALLADAGVVGGEVIINGRTFLFKDFAWLLGFIGLGCEFGAKFYYTRKLRWLLLCLLFTAGSIAITVTDSF
ncbi:MAG TPA: hypothetical protein H9780_05605 [Candidatus Mediterraneibacter merdavium]|nr:hypothetical protein [Candidatus Mediterraneibacter merdavium]